jgi:hypothetical protein
MSVIGSLLAPIFGASDDDVKKENEAFLIAAAAAGGGLALGGGTAGGAAGAGEAGQVSAMSNWGPAAVGAGGSLLGSYLSYEGQKQANEANAAQSAAQMAFQERMSSTAHQREVADLTKAGLNPILSVNAGSSTPGGAQATMQNPVPPNAINAAMTSALEIRKMQNDMQMQQKQIGLLDAQTKGQTIDNKKKSIDGSIGDDANQLYQKGKSFLLNLPDKVKETTRAGAKQFKNWIQPSIQMPKRD